MMNKYSPSLLDKSYLKSGDFIKFENSPRLGHVEGVGTTDGTSYNYELSFGGVPEDEIVLVHRPPRGNGITGCGPTHPELYYRGVIPTTVCYEKKLRSALVGLVGSDNPEELRTIEATTRTYMASGTVPQKDGVAMINAVDALLDTQA